jgi:endonuclease VIII
VPEGDTIFRTARTLHQALAGQTVTRFESVFPKLNRVDADTPIRGRVVEHVEARGKHVLISFTGDLVLRTHMRMNGSWHIYRPGERWQRPHRDMRIVIETAQIHAIAFTVPVAELTTADALSRLPVMRDLGPDPLSAQFDAADAIQRIQAHLDLEIADALLDQTVIAGIGNEFKSEVLFGARVNPFAEVRDLSPETIATIVTVARKFMRANIVQGPTTARYGRRTTGRADPTAGLWVFGREGKPCRRCGTPISRRRQGPHARNTYWCATCQPG